MAKEKFEPRRFEAIVDEFGLDDGGGFSFTFKVQSLTKGKIYNEQNPSCIEGNRRGVVIDDNCCWYFVGDKNFKERFKEVTSIELRDEKLKTIL